MSSQKNNNKVWKKKKIVQKPVAVTKGNPETLPNRQGSKRKVRKDVVYINEYDENKKFKGKKEKIVYVDEEGLDVSNAQSFEIGVKTPMEFNSLKIMLSAFASYLAEKHIGPASFQNSDLGFNSVWSALQYMIEGIYSEATSSVCTLTTRPRIIHDLICGLKDKSVSVRGGKFTYSWTGVPPNPLVSYQVNGLTYWTVTSAGNTTYNGNNFSQYTNGDSEEIKKSNYAKLIKYLENTQERMLQIVDSNAWSPLRRDVSTRCRSYGYCGLQPTAASSWATSVENETPIWCPILAKFVEYNIAFEDMRLPTQLTMASGDPSTPLAIPLTGSFGKWDNRVPVRYLQVDFDEFYTAIVLWMAKAKTAAVNGPSNDDSIARLPFTFSAQSFRIALAQAMKAALGTSYATQFTATLRYNEDANVFLPFLEGGNCIANKQWAGAIRVPTLIAENLAALRLRTIRIPNSQHKAVYIPVLGRWNQDTIVFPAIPGPEGMIPMFNDTLGEDAINILDGTSNALPVDLNSSYYTKVIEDWNAHVAALSPFSSPVSGLLLDHGPKGMPLIFTSRVMNPYSQQQMLLQKKIDEAVAAGDMKRRVSAPPPPKGIINDKYIYNYRGIKRTIGVGKEQRVEYVPPATLPELTDTSIFTLIPNADQALVGMFQFLILPNVRYNLSTPGDILTPGMYQTHTRMINSHPQEFVESVEGQTSYARLDRLAASCIPGLAKDSSEVYEKMISKLQDQGLALDLLKILGGVAGTLFPALSPVVNALTGS